MSWKSSRMVVWSGFDDHDRDGDDRHASANGRKLITRCATTNRRRSRSARDVPDAGHAFQTPTSPSPGAAYIDRVRRDRFLSIAAQAVGSHLVRSVRQDAGGDLDIEAAAGHHAQRLAGPDDIL